MNRVVFSSANMSWKTPDDTYQALNKEFHFDFDPCAPDSLWDGLYVKWGTSNFVNPPYGTSIGKWVKKAYDEATRGKVCVMLIPSRTDTRWWHDYVMKAKEIRFIKGRLKFKGAKYNAPFPSAIVIFQEADHA